MQTTPATSGHGDTIVLYKSKYGSTKQYAEWIAEVLHANAMAVDDVREEHLRDYETVIIGGAVRMGKITCADFLVRHWPALLKKRIVLFSVSASPPNDPQTQGYFERSIPSFIRPHVRYVPLRGRFGKLDLVDRMLMLFPRTAIRLQLLRHPHDEKLRKTYEGMTKPFDHVRKESIAAVMNGFVSAQP